MTQHGTSIVIKQTNDGPRAELRLVEMLQVVARDQKHDNKKIEAQTTSIIHFIRKKKLLEAPRHALSTNLSAFRLW